MRKLKLFLAICALMIGASAYADKTVYFQPNSSWAGNTTRYSLYLFTGETAGPWLDFTAAGDGIYSTTITSENESWASMIICAMNSGTTENNWDNKWNQSNNLNAAPATGLLYTQPADVWDNFDCAISIYGATAASFTDGGKYLFKNVGSGRYLGPGNSWGTQASLIANSHYNTIHAADGKYTIESQVAEKGKYWFSGSFMDSGDKANVTIVENGDGIYNMWNGATYYGYDGTSTVLTNALTDRNADNAKWQIIPVADALNGATLENPVDATFLILCANFDRNHRSSSAWSMEAGNKNLCGGDNINMCAESYHSNFTLSQTIDVPNGIYELTAQGFYRQDGSDNEHLPYFYINGGKQTFLPMGTLTDHSGDGKNGMNDASIEFANGNYTIEPIRVTVTDGTITVGAKLENNTGLWCIFDNFTLKYYGVDLSAYETTISELRSTLNGLIEENAPMNATVKSDAEAIYTATASVAQEQTAMETAIGNLQNAIDAVNASVADYVAAKAQLDRAATLDAAGKANYAANATVAAIQAAYDARTFEALATEQIEACDAALIAAAKAQTTNGADMTLALINPGFETGNETGWTNDGAIAATAQGNKAFDNTQGNYYAERWHTVGTIDINQTVTGLPQGVYEIGAYLYTDIPGGGILYANGSEVKFSTSNYYTTEVAIDADGSIKLGVKCTLTGSTWVCMDGFTLTMVSAGLPDVEAVSGKMNADVAAAQTAAIEAYEANKTVAGFNAAGAAIAAAQASVDAYISANAAITAAEALIEAHNFASAAATATFAEAINTIKDAYTNNTLTTEDASNAGATLGTTTTGWHAGNNSAASNYMENGFGLNDFNAALYVNTWSTEGENDGSNFKAPFYEYWIADANALAANSFTGTVSDLPNGQYKVSAWVRVRAMNGTTATDASGITISVNGGEAVDVTEGEQIGTSQFTLKTFEALGLVKDGNLHFSLNIAEDNNISWLSVKNIKYTKVRDLTEDEAAIAPTAIALFNGEVEVTEIELTAANNSVTLTPSYTPDNASEGYIEWTTSDANVATVANGVVTGVAPGTATITVTSTLDAEVSAQVTVNVVYPESTVPATYEVVEGVTKTVYTLGENLIKNGSFEYPTNHVYGWTTGTGSVNAMVADNFNIPNEGAADGDYYLQAKESKGGENEKSINTSWALEDGKTYVFGYKIKANQQCTTNLQYIGTSLSNTKGSENGNMKFTTEAYGTEWQDVNYTFTNTDNYKFLVFNARWMGSAQSFDNFYLCEVISTEDVDLRAVAADYAALNEAINAHVVGFDAGEYAPYNNVEAMPAYNAAIAIDQEADNLATDVQAATAALNAVTTWGDPNEKEVNAIYDGTFAKAENNGAPAGWRMSNNTLGGDYHARAFVGDDRLAEFNDTKSAFFLRFDGTNSDRGSMYYYGDTEGYTMPLNANTYYRVTVDFAEWGGTPGKPLRMNVTGPEGFTAKTQEYNTSYRADAEKDGTPQQFNIFFKTADAGNYIINFQVPGDDSKKHNVVISNVTLKKEAAYAVVGSKKGDDSDPAIFSGAWDTANTTDLMTEADGEFSKTFDGQELDKQDIAFKVVKIYGNDVTWYPAGDNMEINIPVKGRYDITITFTEEGSVVTGEATKTAEAVTISDKLWATTVTNSALDFSASDVEAYTATVKDDFVVLKKVDNVQAETGLVLKGTAARTYYIPVTESSETDKGSLMFSSTLTYNTWGDHTFYGLTVNAQNEAQFAKIDRSNGEVTLPAGKAFLMIPGENGARQLRVIFADEATGISNIAADETQERIYNLNGQRVNATAKGLYIVNGKKVVRK